MLLNKTNGKVVGDLMTPAPVVVRETTNLEDAAKYSRPSFSFFFLSKLIFLNIPFTMFMFILIICGKKITSDLVLSNARLLLETKYRRLPVVDADGKLVRDIRLFILINII